MSTILSFLAVLVVALLASVAVRRREARRVRHAVDRDIVLEKAQRDLTDLRGLLREYMSQRETAEDEVRAREQQYSALVNALDTVVFQFDAELRWTFLNQAWETVSGWSAADAIGESILQHVVIEDRDASMAASRAILSGASEGYDGVVRLVGADGRKRWLEVRSHPVRTKVGKIVAAGGTLTDVTERVQIERALRQQQSLYQLIADNASDVIILVSPEGRVSYVSPSVKSVLGYSPDEATSIGPRALVLDEHRDLVEMAMRDVLVGTPATIVALARHRAGHLLWLEVAIGPVLDQQERIAGLQITARNVTRQRDALVALEESEAKYRTLAESIDDVVTTLSGDDRIVYGSASMLKTFGYEPSELMERPMLDLVHADDRDAVQAAHAAARRGETPLFQWRCRRRDGEYIWVETHSTLLRGASEENGQLLCVTRNIERRRATEEALRQSEARTRALIDRAAYGIFRCSQDHFLDVNPALVEMLGYPSAAQLRDVNIVEDVFVDPMQRALWRNDVAQDQLQEWYDLTWRRMDGARIQVRLSPRVAHDVHGRTFDYEGIVENVTERLHREEIVRRGERMAALGHTLAGVAHEINNPLAAISGFAQILLRGKHSREDLSAFETIHHEAKRAARIVKDLLTFARRQESQAPERVNVNDVVRYIVDTQRYAMETRGIHATLELEEGAIILADPAQIEQVVLNLVVNARQALESLSVATPERAGGEPPTILIRTMVDDGTVRIEICDNGPGIAASDLPRIWDPFWTTKEEGQGTGLGLSVVHGIVASYGGSIDVESAIDAGTAFTITFERAAREGQEVEVGPVSLREGPATDALADIAPRPLDILVVDDEVAITGLLSRYLSSRGHAVVAANDGRQALRIAEQSSFDVVICDLRMPGMDGRAVIRRLQELPTCANARYILSTGDTATSLAGDDLRLDAIVDKPYEVEVLRRLVETVQENRAASITPS